MTADVVEVEKTDLGPARFIKNSVANLVTGASSALLNVLMPSVLARHLGRAEFSAWALILQLAAYTSLLGLGMQVAVGRFVAIARDKKDKTMTSAIVSTGFFTISALAAVAFGLVAVGAYYLKALFPALPTEIAPTVEFALLLVGGALALGLPFTVLNGVFVGHQRNEIVAFVAGGSRLIIAAVLSTLAVLDGRLGTMGAAYAAICCVTYFAQIVAFRRLYGGEIALNMSFFQNDMFWELGKYCLSLSVWNVSMIMVSGVDVAIVGRVDFNSAAAYSACVGLVTFISGILSALLAPLLQIGAALYEQRLTSELSILLIRSTRWCVVVLLAVAAPLILFSHELLQIWLGSKLADSVNKVLPLLILGNVLRLVATPFALLLLATAQHRRTYVGPLLEGFTNVTVCVLAGIKFGVTGVACGMLAGAIAGQIMNVFYNLPRTHSIDVSIRELCRRSLQPGVLGFIPVAISWVVLFFWPDPLFVLRIAALLIAAWISWQFSLEVNERTYIRGLVAKVFFLQNRGRGV